MSCAGWAHTYRALDLPAILEGFNAAQQAGLTWELALDPSCDHTRVYPIITAVTVLELDVYKTLMLGEFIQDSNTTV